MHPPSTTVFEDIMRHPLIGKKYANINLEVLRRGQDSSDLTDDSFDRLRYVCDKLQIWPRDSARVVMVCGTNGKGTTCSIFESLAISKGYRAAVFSSPEILDTSECIRLNGKRIDSDTLNGTLWSFLEKFPELNFTTFELEFLAFLQSVKSVCSDFLIVEVGLGGEKDATNLLSRRDAVVVTSIAYDHSDIFGDSIEEIASAEASLLQPEDNAFLGDIPAQLRPVFSRQTCLAPTVFDPLTVFENKVIPLVQLRGRDAETLLWSSTYYYTKVVASVFRSFGENVSNDDILEVALSTKQFGRYSCIRVSPEIYLDTAHNRAAVEHLVDWHKSLGREWVPILSIRESRNPDDLVLPLIGTTNDVCFIDVRTKRCHTAASLVERYKCEFPRVKIVGCLSELQFLELPGVIFGSFPGSRQLVLDSHSEPYE